VPFTAWRTIFFPDWWGRPSGVFYAGPFNYNERTIYAGAVVFVLALIGVTVVQAWRQIFPFVLLGAVGFQATFGLQPTAGALRNLPVLAHDRNARLSVLIPLGTAIVAGFGLEAILRRRFRPGHFMLAAVAVVAVIAAGWAGTHPSLNDIRTALHHFRTGEDFATAEIIKLVSVGWWIALVAGLAIVVLLGRRLGAGTVAVAVIALAALDLGHFARGYNPMTPEAVASPKVPGAVRFLQEHQKDARIAGLGVALPPDTSTVYRLRDLRGNDPPGPDKDFMRIFRLINPTQPLGDWLAIPALTAQGRALLDLFDVRFVVTAPGSGGTGQPSFSAVYRGPDAEVYRNDHAKSRAFVPPEVLVPRSPEEALASVGSPGFRPREQAVVEIRAGTTAPAAAGAAKIVRDTAEEVVIRTHLRRRGLVVLSDTFDDGWRVEIDGSHARPLRVDGVLRGVVVPAGDHRVRWRYRTPGLVAGAAVSTSAAVVLLAVAGVLLLTRRRSRSAVLPGDEDEANADDGDTDDARDREALVQDEPASESHGDVSATQEDRVHE
jgi:hypothetical protein